MKNKRKLPSWTPFYEAQLDPDNPERNAALMKQANCHKVVKNSRYTVYIRALPLGYTHLSIKRNDRSPMHDWREMQRIKTEILGPDVEAVEIYPAESRVVDGSNQYHLWCYPPGVQCPLGFFDGRWVCDGGLMGEVQRPFENPSPELAAELVRTNKMLREILIKKGWDKLLPQLKKNGGAHESNS